MKEELNLLIESYKDNLSMLTMKLRSFLSEKETQQVLFDIKGRKIALKKFPTLLGIENYKYPSDLSLQQASSESTARLKAALLTGQTFIDGTGGMGIDTLFISPRFKQSTYLEQQTELFNRAKQNFIAAKLNVTCLNQDVRTFMKETTETFDCLYLDPHRRSPEGKKVFKLEDCQPNVLEMLELIHEKIGTFLLKASPMLDIARAINQLKRVHEVHLIESENECKEILFLLKQNVVHDPKIVVHILNQNGHFKKELSIGLMEKVAFSGPLKYLYEPSPAMMKSGLFSGFLEDCFQLAPNTNLFTSNSFKKGMQPFFRCYEIIDIGKPKDIPLFFPERKTNVKCRNFPVKPQVLVSKYKLSEGGELFLFATRLSKNEKCVLKCKKL